MGNKYNICASIVWLSEQWANSVSKNSGELKQQNVQEIVRDLEERMTELAVKLERAKSSLSLAVDTLKNKAVFVDSAWNDGFKDEDEFQEMADSLLTSCNLFKSEMVRTISPIE
jgi:hypothetical protein